MLWAQPLWHLLCASCLCSLRPEWFLWSNQLVSYWCPSLFLLSLLHLVVSHSPFQILWNHILWSKLYTPHFHWRLKISYAIFIVLGKKGQEIFGAFNFDDFWIYYWLEIKLLPSPYSLYVLKIVHVTILLSFFLLWWVRKGHQFEDYCHWTSIALVIPNFITDVAPRLLIDFSLLSHISFAGK